MAQLLLFLFLEMDKELRCAEVFEGCPYVGRGADIREVMAEYMGHVSEVHRVTAPTPELRIQAMVAVRECQPQPD